MSIEQNIKDIQKIKGDTAVKSGRKPEDVLLVGVTKTRSIDEINEAIDCGITDIGENKVQEVMDKYEHIKPVKWHFIGHLQTNKVKYIIDKIDLIHSVDSKKLVDEIEKRASKIDRKIDILIQVNAAMEESKFGISENETKDMIQYILENCPHICIKGLMCIAPFEENPEEVAVFFRTVKKQYDEFSEIKHNNLDFKYLSMGMSNDFEVAILEGSNLVRVGTAIFGARNYNK